ncbi:MAG: DUF1318 domain-containing protein [Candidatus Hydrogenedentes bacterium]|jgi:hypothetical protein|nr:DUF1318 domain-containing protein [Candidatus Hydrogenedentota bacterium]
MMQKRFTLAAFSLMFLLVGCAHIGNPFTTLRPDYSIVPEDELRAFAKVVEQFVLQGEREPQLGEFPSIASDNEDVLQAIRTRAARSELLQELLDTGFAYEQKSGTISIIRSKAYKRASDKSTRDQNALLVMGENANRWTLYETLVKASGWKPGSLGAVQHAFFEARCELLSSGQRYETPDGTIVTK